MESASVTEGFIFEYVLTGGRVRNAAQAPRSFEKRRIRVNRFARVFESFSAADASTTHHHYSRISRSGFHRFHRSSVDRE